jgi:hypothetical protein
MAICRRRSELVSCSSYSASISDRNASHFQLKLDLCSLRWSLEASQERIYTHCISGVKRVWSRITLIEKILVPLFGYDYVEVRSGCDLGSRRHGVLGRVKLGTAAGRRWLGRRRGRGLRRRAHPTASPPALHAAAASRTIVWDEQHQRWMPTPFPLITRERCGLLGVV